MSPASVTLLLDAYYLEVLLYSCSIVEATILRLDYCRFLVFSIRDRRRDIVEATIPMEFFSHSGSTLFWVHLRLSSPRGYLPTFCSIHCLFLTWMGCKVLSRQRYHSSCRTYFGHAKWGTVHNIVEAMTTEPFFLHCSSH